MPPGKTIQSHSIKHWRKDQQLVVIGKNTCRALESYKWGPGQVEAANRVTARGLQRLSKQGGIHLSQGQAWTELPDQDGKDSIIGSEVQE